MTLELKNMYVYYNGFSIHGVEGYTGKSLGMVHGKINKQFLWPVYKKDDHGLEELFGFSINPATGFSAWKDGVKTSLLIYSTDYNAGQNAITSLTELIELKTCTPSDRFIIQLENVRHESDSLHLIAQKYIQNYLHLDSVLGTIFYIQFLKQKQSMPHQSALMMASQYFDTSFLTKCSTRS